MVAKPLVCQHCKHEMVISWQVQDEIWKLLPKKFWAKVLCLECFVYVVSVRHKNLVILELHNFTHIIFGAKRVRGSLTGPWPFKGGRRF